MPKRLWQTMENNPLFNKVLRFVSIRPRSKKEISDYIKTKLYKKRTPDEIDKDILEIMQSLEELNLVNDEFFARSFIEWRLASSNPKGFRIIREELFVKGVDKCLVGELLGDEEYKEMEKKAAEKVVLKKSRNYKDPRALKNYVFSRGFSQAAVVFACGRGGI